MPKQVYSNFEGGLSLSDKVGNDNQFWIGRAVDIYEKPGFLFPGWQFTAITLTSLTSGKYVREIIVDAVNGIAYIFTNDASHSAYMINSISANTLVTNVDGSSNPFVAIANMSGDMKGLIYSAKNNTAVTRFAFVCYNSAGDIARVQLSGSTDLDASHLIKDFLTNIIYLGASALDTTGRRDVIEFRGYAFFTNGRYIAKYDGNGSGNYGDWTAQFFDLGVGWTADCLFTTGDYLGICASKSAGSGNISECRVYLIDLSSNTLAVKIIPIANLNRINGVRNKDGIIYICGDGRTRADVVGVLTDNGFKEIYKIRIETNGILRYIGTGNKNNMDVMDDRLFFGLDINNKEGESLDAIMSLDRNDVLTMPIATNSNTGSGNYIPTLKVVLYNKIYIAKDTNGTFTFGSLARGGGSTATYSTPYKEFAQKIRINYIKVYFRQLASGDSATISLNTDDGLADAAGNNSVAIPLGIGAGNIAYGNEAVVTYKRFDVKKICHSFRVNIAFLTGTVTISKIVVDYDFVDDL